MTEQQRHRWETLLEQARRAALQGSQCTETPLDLLLAVDLELSALWMAFQRRQNSGSGQEAIPQPDPA